jgi:hypothetical protein
MAGLFKDPNKPSGAMKCKEFLVQPSFSSWTLFHRFKIETSNVVSKARDAYVP